MAITYLGMRVQQPTPPPRHDRGATTARGYGYPHQQARRRALAQLTDGTPCGRCGAPMYKTQPLDLDHDDYDRTKYRPQPLAHASCNRSAGSTLGHHQRNNMRQHQPTLPGTTRPNTSYSW